MPGQRAKRRGVQFVMIVGGGAAGCVAAVLVLWYGFGKDPFGFFLSPKADTANEVTSNADNPNAKRRKSAPCRNKPSSPKRPTVDDAPSDNEPPEDTERTSSPPATADTVKLHAPPDTETYKAKLAEVRNLPRGIRCRGFIAIQSRSSIDANSRRGGLSASN